MRRTITFVLIIIMALAFATFASTFVRAFFYAPDESIEVPQIAPDPLLGPEQYPARLLIPSLAVDAEVQHVGVTENGNMATPSNFKDVGWYKHGVTPGGSGSAVIAGHVDNGLGLAGVFNNLADLEEGDDIYVRRPDGSEVHFVVTGKRAYPYDDVPVDVLFNPVGSVRLNLITCDGEWLAEDKTYDQRLVVFAKLASE